MTRSDLLSRHPDLVKVVERYSGSLIQCRDTPYDAFMYATRRRRFKLDDPQRDAKDVVQWQREVVTYWYSRN